MKDRTFASTNSRYFGDRAFYRRVAAIVLPMIIQNTLTNIVSLLDNIMVGRVGTLQMSAVAIVNQILFVFYLCVFGAVAGAGIYTTQFFGRKDDDGVRYSVRFKLFCVALLTAGTLILLLTAGRSLIGTYIAKETSAADASATMQYAMSYMMIMLTGLVPFSLTQVYAGTMRESGHTGTPMAASMAAMAINFVLNLLLIFGLLGFPRLGVKGAAIATVVSRFAEFAIVAFRSHRDKETFTYIRGLYSSLYIPRNLFISILVRALPLFLNEFLWSFGQARLLQCYSVRGLNVIAAMNIANTISQIFMSFFLSMGNAAGILTDQQLGAGEFDTAKQTADRMITLSFMVSIATGLILFLISPVFPAVYNTEPEVRRLASKCLKVVAVTAPLAALANAMYFVIRSGGKTFITFLFDSCFMWVATVPAAYVLTHYTDMPAVLIYLCVMMLDLIKCVIGLVMIKKGIWVKNIVA
ncbi:MAG: MATE family efflux transporter [Lachnospiraceae bacterium]|nr:MATE family efflux transporter [Lachnospiraceae bacterium]